LSVPVYTWVLRTIDTHNQSVQANSSFISSNQSKNAPQCVLFSIGIFLFKNEIACSKKVETGCQNEPLNFKLFFAILFALLLFVLFLHFCLHFQNMRLAKICIQIRPFLRFSKHYLTNNLSTLLLELSSTFAFFYTKRAKSILVPISCFGKRHV
jgi:hypothetical protein